MNMELQVRTRDDGEASVVDLSGCFSHETGSQFSKAMRECMPHAGREVVVDFGAVEYIDSMAMGTLLVYRERLANAGKTLVLRNCTGRVRDAMNLAGFQKIFEIR